MKATFNESNNRKQVKGPSTMWGYAGFGIVGMIGMVFFWGAVIWAISRAGSYNTYSNAQVSATQILEARFARGEIDIDEFESRRRGLGN